MDSRHVFLSPPQRNLESNSNICLRKYTLYILLSGKELLRLRPFLRGGISDAVPKRLCKGHEPENQAEKPFRNSITLRFTEVLDPG